jgi:hypothetical protein
MDGGDDECPEASDQRQLAALPTTTDIEVFTGALVAVMKDIMKVPQPLTPQEEVSDVSAILLDFSESDQ